MSERIISSRVIDSHVVNSGGILGGVFGGVTKKFNSIGAAIGGLCVAPIVFALAVAGLVYGENLAKSSEIISKLPLESAESVVGQEGMKKIEGDLNVVKSVSAPEVGQVAYYKFVIEEYKEVEKKQTRKETVRENGQEVEKTIEETVLVEEFVENESDEEWGEVKVGPITVDAENANLHIDFEEKKFLQDLTIEGDYREITSNSQTYKVGDIRLSVSYLPLEQEMIAIGELSQNSISSGEVFILSNKTDAKLLEDIVTGENFAYWGVKVLTFFLFMASIMMIVRPILEIVEMIPIAGTAANIAATVIAAMIAFFIVLIGSIIVKFWWLFLIIGFVLAAVLLFVLFSKSNKNKAVKN